MTLDSIRLLLVEDNPGDARLLSEMLAEWESDRFEEVYAGSLAEAVATLGRSPVDAVLLDLSLPDAHGMATVSAVKAAAPSIPIVVLTGLDDQELAVRAVKGGAQDYLIKGQVGGPLLARAVRYAIERKRLEEERRRLLTREQEAREEAEAAYERARRATRQRDDVLATVTHDLRSPLHTIILGTGGALDRGDLDAEAARLVTVILRTAERMKRLIEDLLDVASIESGKLPIRPRPHDIGHLIRDHADRLEPEAKKQGLELGVEIADELPKVLADPDRIEQVLSNLLSNAIRLTPEGGRIQIRAGPAGSAVQVSIADTGPGIPPEIREGIFDRFWQPPHSPQRAGGTGLGLAIVRGIIENHGGRVWLESAERGGGTTFSFTIPAAPGPEGG